MTRSFALPRFNLKCFYLVFERFVNKNLARFYVAECNGIKIATLMPLLWKDKIFGWIAGATSDRYYLRFRPNHLLINHLIEEGCRNGYAYYELGCAPTQGLKNFKSGWNADLMPLYTVIKVIRKPSVKNFFVKKILELGRRING